MSMNNMGVGITINGKDNSGAAVKHAESGFSGLFNTIRKGWQNSSLALGAMGYKFAQVGAKINSSFKMAAEQSATFERSMSFVQARTGSTTAQMEAFRNQLLGKEFEGKSVDAAAATFQRLAEETGNANDAMVMLKSAMNLARVAGIDETSAASMLKDVMGEFGLKAADSAITTDKMAWAMKRFGIVGSELQPMLFGVASGAQLAKASFDDTLLTLGMMKQVIPNASRAAMAANMAMVQLANPEVQKELKKQGVIVADNTGKMKPLVDILGELSASTANMTEAQKATSLASIFSARSSGGLSIVMDKLNKGITTATGTTVRGAEAVAYLKTEMAGAAGTTAEMAKVITNDYAGALKRAENAQRRFSQSIGAVTAELRRPFVEAGARAINTLVDAFRSMPPGAQKMIVGFAAAFGGMASVLGKLLIASAAMKMFNIGIIDLVFSIGKFLIIGGGLTLLLGGLGIGLYTLYRATQKNAGGIGDSISEMGRKVKLGWSAVVDIFQNGKLSDAMKKELAGAENSGVMKFALMIERLRVRLGAFFEGFSSGFKRALDELGPTAREMLGQFQWLVDMINGEAFKDPLGNWSKSGDEAGYAMKDFALTAMKYLKKAGEAVGGFIDWISQLNGKDIADGILTLRDRFNDITSAISEAGSVLGAFVDLLKIVFGIGGMAASAISDVANVLSYATGQIDKPEFERGKADVANFMEQSKTRASTGFNSLTTSGEDSENWKTRGRELRDIMGTKYDEKNTVNGQTYSWGKDANGKINEESAKAYRSNMVELQKINDNLRSIGEKPITLIVDGKVLAQLTGAQMASDGERTITPTEGEGSLLGVLGALL